MLSTICTLDCTPSILCSHMSEQMYMKVNTLKCFLRIHRIKNKVNKLLKPICTWLFPNILVFKCYLYRQLLVSFSFHFVLLQLTRPAQELLMSLALNCNSHSSEDVEVISNLIRMRLKTKPLANHYVNCIKYVADYSMIY